jgi:hypothetical protein
LRELFLVDVAVEDAFAQQSLVVGVIIGAAVIISVTVIVLIVATAVASTLLQRGPFCSGR